MCDVRLIHLLLLKMAKKRLSLFNQNEMCTIGQTEGPIYTGLFKLLPLSPVCPPGEHLVLQTPAACLGFWQIHSDVKKVFLASGISQMKI